MKQHELRDTSGTNHSDTCFSHDIKLWVDLTHIPERRRGLCKILPYPTPPCHHDRGCCYCCFFEPLTVVAINFFNKGRKSTTPAVLRTIRFCASSGHCCSSIDFCNFLQRQRHGRIYKTHSASVTLTKRMANLKRNIEK